MLVRQECIRKYTQALLALCRAGYEQLWTQDALVMQGSGCARTCVLHCIPQLSEHLVSNSITRKLTQAQSSLRKVPCGSLRRKKHFHDDWKHHAVFCASVELHHVHRAAGTNMCADWRKHNQCSKPRSPRLSNTRIRQTSSEYRSRLCGAVRRCMSTVCVLTSAEPGTGVVHVQRDRKKHLSNPISRHKCPWQGAKYSLYLMSVLGHKATAVRGGPTKPGFRRPEVCGQGGGYDDFDSFTRTVWTISGLD